MRASRWRTAAAAAAAVALAGGGTAVAQGRLDRPDAVNAWEVPAVDDGLERLLVTLDGQQPQTGATGTSVQGARLPSFLLTASAAETGARPGLDLDALERAQAELGHGGQLRTRAAGTAGVVLYVVGEQERVVGTAEAPEPTGGTADEPTGGRPAVVEVAPAATGPALADGPLAAPDPAALAALRDTPGIRIVQELHDGTLHVTTSLTLEQVEQLPGVATVEPSAWVPVLGGPSSPDPYYDAYSWNLENTGANAYQQTATADADVDATAAWSRTAGDGAVVAVVDTGFDSDHPDLAGSLWNNPAERCDGGDTDGNGKAGDCHGWNFYANSADVDNGAGGTHGTSVSGVVAARGNNGVGSLGLAPGATIMPLVIGSGQGVDANLGALAIRYAVDHGADVINASWGGAFSGTALTNLRSAIDYAGKNDVLVIAAAGNDAANRDISTMYPAGLAEPNVITVGSTTAQDTISPTSAYGATTVDLFAPGNKVFTTWNNGDYMIVSGTSIAAPHVAAAVALHRSVRPEMTAAELEQTLVSTADRLDVLAGKSVSGGRLNVASLAAPAPVTGLQHRFAGMGRQAPGELHPTITLTGDAPAGEHALDLTLLTRYDGSDWAVADHDIVLDGVRATTDETGTARFALGDAGFATGRTLSAALELPEGTYALVAQVRSGADAVGRPVGAPLVVAAAAPGGGSTPTPSGSSSAPRPSTTAAPSTTPRPSTTPAPTTSPAPTTPAPSTTSRPSTTTAPTSSPSATGSAPGTSPTPGGSSTPAPGASSPAPGAAPTASGTPAPTGTRTPVTPAPSTSASSTPAPSSSAPGTSPTPGATASPPGGGDPGLDGGAKDYPSVGDFRVTRISPARVGTGGGTPVAVTGQDFPSTARVLVGRTTAVAVASWTSTRLTFTAPDLLPGVYDVTVSAPDGRASVLAGGLTVVAPTGTSPAPGASPTPSATRTPSSAPSSAPTSAPTTAPSSAPTTAPGGGPAAPREVVGPGGLRLVRTQLAVPASLWGAPGCATGCSGVQLA